MNISLTTTLKQLVKKKVDSGMYNNSSEVIREALRQMDINEKLLQELKLERLKNKLKPGIDDVRNNDFVKGDVLSVIANYKKHNADA